jgi:hypothetical protein
MAVVLARLAEVRVLLVLPTVAAVAVAVAEMLTVLAALVVAALLLSVP